MKKILIVMIVAVLMVAGVAYLKSNYIGPAITVTIDKVKIGEHVIQEQRITEKVITENIIRENRG